MVASAFTPVARSGLRPPRLNRLPHVGVRDRNRRAVKSPRAFHGTAQLASSPEGKLRRDAVCEVNNMSTRGCIARLKRRSPLEFKGVYHLWDSHPWGLGKALFRIREKLFGRNTDAMLKVLIDQHSAGWITIVGRDFSKMPSARRTSDDNGPECYCHGGRSEAGRTLTQTDAADSGVDYAYIFDGSKMLVAGSYCRDGSGMGGRKGAWSILAEVDLDGAEPDWGSMEMGVRN